MHVSVMLPILQVSNSFFPFNPSLEDEMKRLFDNFAVDSRSETQPNGESLYILLYFYALFRMVAVTAFYLLNVRYP